MFEWLKGAAVSLVCAVSLLYDLKTLLCKHMITGLGLEQSDCGGFPFAAFAGDFSGDMCQVLWL